MTTTESNKLIAEFMGYKPESPTDDRYFNMPDRYYKYDVDHYKVSNTYYPENMLYHSSWDWLMPVVVECFNRQDDLSDSVFNADNLIFKITDALLETNIDSLYKAVVEFILNLNR